MRTVHSPVRIRQILTEAEVLGTAIAAQRGGVDPKTVSTWRRRREASGGVWPSDVDVAEWEAAQTPEAVEARHKNARKAAAYRARVYLNRGPLMVDATGTIRRVHALMRMGWPTATIAGLCGWRTGEAVTALGYRTKVTAVTAAHVAVAYDALSMRLGPSDQVRQHAARQGWAPPLAWDNIDDPTERPSAGGGTNVRYQDPIAVERVLSGDIPPYVTPAERREAVRRWAEAGRPLRELEQLTGWRTCRYYRIKEAA